MTISQAGLATDPAATTDRFRRAGEAHDVDGMLRTLSPDVVLHSPITAAVDFQGRDEIAVLLRAVFAVIHDIRFFADVGDARTRALFYRAVAEGHAIEEAILVELDDAGLIEEIRLFIRPFGGLAAVTAALGPLVARRHGRLRALLATLLLAPLRLVARGTDGLAKWLT